MNNFKLFQNSETVRCLKEKSDIFNECDIKAWVRSENGYNIYIFTVLLKNEQELIDYWERLTNSIAMHFQSELEKNIEIWNIYVVFLVEEQISKQLKYDVEQDKYSSRKIVYDSFRVKINESIDLQIKYLLDNKLFGFQLHQLKMLNLEARNEELGSIEDNVKKEDANLYQVIKYAKNNPNANPRELLNIYMR